MALRLVSLLAAAAALGACNSPRANDGGAKDGGPGGASSSTSATTAVGSTSIASSGATSSGAGSGGAPACSPPCGAHQSCEAASKTCVCDPGYVDMGGACVAAAPGDPSTHTQEEVCNEWSQGHVLSDPVPFSSSGACDPGVLSQKSITDTLTRINMFRWMVGLGPTDDDPALDVAAQQCADLESWWPWMGGSPHMPPASSMCYTQAAADAANWSIIAWGSGNPAQAIDVFMQDIGNAATMAHRRWLVNPPLGPVGIGYWQTGGMYDDAECVRVFPANGDGPNPPWLAMPPPGFVPIDVAAWTWTFHGSIGGVASAQISMLRVDDNTPLMVTVTTLMPGLALDAISWTPNGWQPEVGKTYRVTVSGLTGGAVTYDVKPVMCD